jgi:hypothetical protein
VQNVLKEDKVTPADPFDFGSGRIDLTKAGNPGLTIEASAADMIRYANDPVTSANLNIPSLDIPVLPGRLETSRTAKNVSGKRVRYDIEVTSPDGGTIEVSPKHFTLAKEQSAELAITVSAPVPKEPEQLFGEIRLVPRTAGLPTLHVPVAFVPQQTPVTLTQTCSPTDIARGANTLCTVTAENTSYNPVDVDIATTTSRELHITAAQGATVSNGVAAVGKTLGGKTPGNPSIAPGELFGFIPLSVFGVPADPVGDETLINYDVDPYVYGGVPYTTIGVTSDGYLVAGEGTAEDIEFEPSLPDPARPNNVLAPFWTDLTGTKADGVRVADITDGVDHWIVVEWDLNVVGTTLPRTFQVWIGSNGEQDITYAYDPDALPADPSGKPFVVGAENVNGTAGATIGDGVLPTEDLRVTSSEPERGDVYSYQVTATGVRAGAGTVTTELTSPQLVGTTVVTSAVNVTRR